MSAADGGDAGGEDEVRAKTREDASALPWRQWVVWVVVVAVEVGDGDSLTGVSSLANQCTSMYDVYVLLPLALVQGG